MTRCLAFKRLRILSTALGWFDNGASSKNLLLNIYEPSDIGVPVPAKRPTVLFIHGGGFVQGNKSSFSQVPIWASYGYNVVSIDYRLLGDNPPVTAGPADHFPWDHAMDGEINAAIEDATKALEWTFNNAATYGIDSQRIGLAGVSAGAIVSLATAYLGSPPGETPKVVLDLMGAMYGQESAIQPGGPPAFVVHGTNDRTLPFAQDQAIVNRLTNLGIYNAFYVEQGIGHEVDWTVPYDGKNLSQNVLEFLANELAIVPEPSSGLLLSCGFGILWLAAKSIRRSAARH